MHVTLRRILYTAVIAIIGLQHLTAQTPPVVINEFLASNVRTNGEMLDFGDFNDWIELHNPTDTAYVFNNCYLTDDPEMLLRWQIPNGLSLQPGEFLLVWADGFDDIPGNTHVRPNWPWDSFTTSNYHTNFKLSADGEFLGISKTEAPATETLISQGSTWFYLDDGSNQGVDWRYPDFDHSTWASGPAQLGYGDGDENTEVGYGPDSNNKYITTYFIREFEATSQPGQTELVLNLLYDDGAVLYLNGEELMRVNLPDTPINYTTTTLTYIGGADEDDFHEFVFSTENLLEGTNTIAVEIHQHSGTSSDISFDLELQRNVYNAVSILDSVSFGSQIDDVSMGRFPDGSNTWLYFGDPTPGDINPDNGRLTQTAAQPAQISQPSGFYPGPVTVSADPEIIGDEVHYSINGSRPDILSPGLNEPAEFSMSLPLRTRTYSDDLLPSPSTYHSYFLNEPASELPVVSIIADPVWLWDDQLGLLENEMKQREIPVGLQFFSPEGELLVDIQAGMRLAGLNIWRFAQKPLLIKMRNRYGFGELAYPIFENSPVTAYTELALRNGGDNWANAMLRDAMTPALLGERMTNARQAYQPVVSYLNGEYWGIYNLREKFDKTYFQQNLGVNPNDYDHVGMTVLEGWNVVEEIFAGSRQEYDDLLDFLSGQNLNDAQIYEQLQTMMDVDDFMDNIITQLFVCNTSWNHNREWWKSASLDNRWRWIIVDLDRGFNMDNINDDMLSELGSGYTVFNRLLGTTFFDDRFLQRFAAHLQTTFLPDRITAIVDSLSARIEPELPRHIERWQADDGIQSMNAWYNSLDDIRDFGNQRGENIFNHLNNYFGHPGFVQVELNITGDGILVIEDIPLTDTTTSIQLFRGVPVNLRAQALPGFVFQDWGAGEPETELNLTIQTDTTLTLNFTATDENILPSTVDSELILNQASGPYLVTEDLLVSETGTLIIQAGTVLNMAQGASLIVQGGLESQGTVEMPVVFQRAANQPGPWGAICLDHAVLPVSIENTRVTGASEGAEPIAFPAAISSQYSVFSIDGAVIEEVPFPIFAEGGIVEIRNSQLSATTSGDYINVRESNQVLIENNRFYGMNQYDTDGLDLDGVSQSLVKGNRFYHFGGENSDGIDIGEQSSNISIEGNLIYHCLDKGISVGQGSTVSVIRNLIVGCGYGVAVKDSNSFAYVNQNTLFGNQSQLAAYEKNTGAGGGTVQAENNILANSMQATLLQDVYSELEIAYSISDTEELPGTGNQLVDPGFISPEFYNFELLTTSPALDNGNPETETDPDGSPADIGAYYSFDDGDYPYQRPPKVVINEIMYNDDSEIETGDWLEIANASDVPVNIQNWVFKDGNPQHHFIIEEEQVLFPGAFAVFCVDLQAFDTFYPEVDTYPVEIGFGLSSAGELLRLTDETGQMRSTVFFSSDPPWPDEANGGGSSLELVNPQLEVSHVGSWAASLNAGTPGAQNSQFSEICESAGDVNQDGSLDVLDVVFLVTIILTEVNPEYDVFCQGDINQDGSLDVLDIVIIVQIILS